MSKEHKAVREEPIRKGHFLQSSELAQDLGGGKAQCIQTAKECMKNCAPGREERRWVHKATGGH